MTDPQFDSILKAVSRSFYLSIRILPSTMRKPVAVAYMLARAADALTDNADINRQTQLKLLLDLRQLLSENKRDSLNSIVATGNQIEHAGEKILLQRLPDIFELYHKLDQHDKTAVMRVVTTLTKGMENDLTIFASTSQVEALKNGDALDEYTYLVAGCVGEFWTELSLQHVNAVRHWQKEEISQLGIKFGKALQLTNILRDISKDYQLGRCYLPASDLRKNSLNPEMIAEPGNIKLFRPVISKWLLKADEYYDAAEQYLLSIPWYCIRLRLAALWPILIGLKTLNLLKSSNNLLDPQHNVKVKRYWVYNMLLASIPLIFFNFLIKLWIKQIRAE